MAEERIRAALREVRDTRDVLIGPDVLPSIDVVVRRNVGDRAVVVVADDTTWWVAGQRVQQTLEAAGRATATPYVFPAGVYADHRNVETLRDALRAHPVVPVAVGSGTVNDLVKRAAHELGRPYLAVATAASVDGYTASGASLTRNGYKQTMACPAPRALLADVHVLSRAPARMTASGYGDLLGKVTAGADWLVADALQVEPIDPRAWSLVQGPLREAIGQPAELAAGDHPALHGLIDGLVLSGLAIQAHASSRPASGAEHQFSHLWEMERPGHVRSPQFSHGFGVGVGSIAVTALYERILQRDLTALDIDALGARWPTADQLAQTVTSGLPAADVAAAAVAESLAKHVDPAQLVRRLTLLRECWPELRARLAAQLLPADRLAGMLRAAGCPTRPSEIGLTRAVLRETYRRARMIRRRYTVLDLAVETGILDGCVDELFSDTGIWDTGIWADA